MEFLLNNWYLFIAFLAIIGALFFIGWNYGIKTYEQKIEVLRNWLEWAVVEAEKKLGSKTGQLKLRYVYDMALKRFPWMDMLMSFEDFSLYVDEALEWMRKQMADNDQIKQNIEEGK